MQNIIYWRFLLFFLKSIITHPSNISKNMDILTSLFRDDKMFPKCPYKRCKNCSLI